MYREVSILDDYTKAIKKVKRMLAEIANKGTDLATADLEALRQSGQEIETHSLSAATRKVYNREIASFETWATGAQLACDPADPASVYGYLVYLNKQGKALATVTKVAAVLSAVARDRGFASPLKNPKVAKMLKGLRKKSAGEKQDCRDAIPLEQVKVLLATLATDTFAGIRGRAIMLLGFVGALRRSEIVALDIEDAIFDDRGVTLHIRRSKTDQEGKGEPVAIPYGSTLATCPVRALKAWVELLDLSGGIKHGNADRNALFRSVNRHGQIGERLTPQSVAALVKDCARAAGIDGSHLSAHSLRAGCATQAAKKGVSAVGIKRLGRWKSNTYERYVRFETVWDDAPAAQLGI